MAEHVNVGRRRRRSDSFDSVYSSEYKTRRSHSPPSSRSFASDTGSGRTSTETVSCWTKQRAENLGIFYAKEATDIAEFYKISKNCPVEEWFIHPFTGKNKQILESIVKFTNEKLKRTTEFCRPLILFNTIKQDLQYAGEMKRCEEMLNETENSEVNESDQQLKWYLKRSLMKIEGFFAQLLVFLTNRWNKEEIAENEFTMLFSKFSEIFLLNVDYIPQERCLEINSVPTVSIPSLRMTACRQHMTSLVAVVEVKETALMERESLDKFRIQEVVNDRVLGQLAGELLLDRGASVFGRAVLGILCMQTSMIFTYLEISDAHMQRIVEAGEGEDRIESESEQSVSHTKRESEQRTSHTKPEGEHSDSHTNRDGENCERHTERDSEHSERHAERDSKHSDREAERGSEDSDSNTKMEDRDSGSKEENSGIIHYTRPYDYMNEADRAKVTEFLIWLGLQSLPGKHRLKLGKQLKRLDPCQSLGLKKNPYKLSVV